MDLENFTPLPSLAGGAVIGLSAALFVLLTGRVAGISGILGGALKPAPGDVAWRIAFILGLMAAPGFYVLLGGVLPPMAPEAGTPLLVIAGLLVGFGTRLGGGCTSGHGVCGIARLSPRSILATGVFMVTAAAIVFMARHVFGG